MKLIVGNHKMNLSLSEIEDYIDYFKKKNYSNVYFAPSNIYLLKFIDNNLNTVSQDVSSNKNGAFTGDISASQLKNIGIMYSIVGHSERREYHNDDCLVNSKLIRLLEEGINPILCIGESKEERENNIYLEKLEREIDEAFASIAKEYLSKIIVAYEPIWSIGTGLIPKNSEIEEVIRKIKNYVKEKYFIDVKVLYGGSVNNKNIDNLEAIKNIDGYLVGGCSLKKEDFAALIESIH